MEQIGTNIRRKEAVGHSLYPPTCGKSLAACLPQDTTRLSAECKDCGGDEARWAKAQERERAFRRCRPRAV
jgi:hypothetical protein